MRGEARAAILFKNLEDLFAIAEGIKERRHRADIERMRAQPKLVAGHAIQFGQNYANIIRARVRFSAIFSTPRCRYPMTHSVPRTFSPSSFRMTRNTPCVAGCWGPMLMMSSFESRYGFSGGSRWRGDSESGSVLDYL